MSLARITQILEKALDRFTQSPSVITTDHKYIHDGLGFKLIGNTGSLAGDATYSIGFVTPNKASNAYIHFRPALFYASANNMRIELYEGAALAGGSAGAPVNLNRNSETASKVTSTLGATTATGGTLIWQDVSGAGSSPSNRTGGASSGAEHERVLKPATSYRITVTNGPSTASVGYYELFWYEEGNGV
jgi:hypothetical protein